MKRLQKLMDPAGGGTLWFFVTGTNEWGVFLLVGRGIKVQQAALSTYSSRGNYKKGESNSGGRTGKKRL